MDWIISFLTIKTLLVGLLAGLLVKWITDRRKYKLPPGPTPLPIVGNMLQIRTEMMHDQLLEWSKKFGPVISVYFGPTLIVVVNDIESIMDVSQGADFAGRYLTPSLDDVSDGGKNIIYGPYGHLWKLEKRIAKKALRNLLLGKALEERIHKAINLVCQELKNVESPINPTRYIDLMMGNILIGACFGGAHTLTDPEVDRLLDLEDEAIRLGVFVGSGILEDLIPGLQYVVETSNMKWLKNTCKEIKAMFLPKLREHENSFDPNNMRDLTDFLLMARKEAENSMEDDDENKLTDIHLYQTLKDVFFAGIDTTRHTLGFAILHMVAYPDIQAKVQEELDRVVDPLDLPRLSHRPDLCYTEAVIRESMRLSTVVPLGIPHTTRCDTKLNGYDVPGNTLIFINHWALHYDPNVWKDPHNFIPERFLDTDGKLAPIPEHWFPFGTGKRVCLGESVAKPELLLLFAALMQKFRWKIPVGKKVDLAPSGSLLGMPSIHSKPHELLVENR